MVLRLSLFVLVCVCIRFRDWFVFELFCCWCVVVMFVGFVVVVVCVPFMFSCVVFGVVAWCCDWCCFVFVVVVCCSWLVIVFVL